MYKRQEYIFCNEVGARKTKLQFLNKLRRAQRAVKFEKEKGSHCIRRTVASRMNSAGIALEEIRRWLGHTDLETTLKYIYNPFRESETNEKIKNNSILTSPDHWNRADQTSYDRTVHILHD